MTVSAAYQARIDAVRERVEIAAVIKGAIVLRGGRNLRGKCPFHGSKSESFAVYPDRGFAKCWGCDWSGDAIRFVADHYGLSFSDALVRLEQDLGVDGLAASPRRTEKVARALPERHEVDSATMGRWIWRGAHPDAEKVRIYLRARGVPSTMLGADRLLDIRFHGLAPIVPWSADLSGPDGGCPKAPAICALIRRPFVQEGRVMFVPIGLHVTWLAPSLEEKMERRRWDGDLYPSRKMLGEAQGGCVILGPATAIGESSMVSIAAEAPLYAGEGIETVLSGMAIAGATSNAVGLAALSLGNLAGHPKLWKGGVLPLHDIRPDPDKAPALAFAHLGPVTGLIDADMKPLRGIKDRETGEFRGFPVVERRGGPIVRRAISSAERSAICAELFVKAWRGSGCRRVTAARPHMGQDFNDAVRALEGVE